MIETAKKGYNAKPIMMIVATKNGDFGNKNMVIVMIRCKQLASCLAKEEEAQVQQVIPVSMHGNGNGNGDNNGNGNDNDKDKDNGNGNGNGNGRRRSWQRGLQEHRRSMQKTLPSLGRCSQNRGR